MPITLKAEIERIADVQHRTRNGQIVHFLAEAVARHAAEKNKPALYTLPELDPQADLAAESQQAPYGVKPQTQSQSQGASKKTD